jgi:hypothetical protein
MSAESVGTMIVGDGGRSLRDQQEAERQQRETERVHADLDAQLAQHRARSAQRHLTPDDIDAMEADAKARLSELEQRRQRLAPDALLDPQAADRLSELEAEAADLQVKLGRFPLARAEAKRRQEEAARKAAEQRPFLEKAAKLKAQRAKAAKAVDRAAVAYAEALKAWDSLTTEQELVLRQAGHGTPADRRIRPSAWMVESGLQRALIDAHLPHGIIRLELQAGARATLRPDRIAPLAELDAPLGAVPAQSTTTN